MYFPILKRGSLQKVFELIHRDIRDLEILSNDDLDLLKTKTKKTALFSFRQYNKNPLQNFYKRELAALTNLSTNKDSVIQQSDKVNSQWAKKILKTYFKK